MTTTISALVPAFDIACALWAAHEADHDAADVLPGDPLAAASDLQEAIGALMAAMPAATSEEALAKIRVADRLEVAAAEGRIIHRLRASAGDDLFRLAA
jgi:hypothetical protein